MALVMTLIFTTAITGASIAFIGARQSDALTMRAQIDAIRAQAVLDAALLHAAAFVAGHDGRRPLPDRLGWTFDDARIAVRLENEAGKVDLNVAEEGMLQALPLALGFDEGEARAFADTVIDWRDDNDARRVNGAEDRDYRRSEATSGAADRPFAHPAELRYLPVVDPAAWSLLAPYVTIYSGEPMPRRRKAAPVVREAMLIARGLQPSGAEEEDKENGNDRRAARTRRTQDISSRRASARDRDEAPPGDDDEDDDAADNAGGIYTLRLDVRLASGYEAAARAVVAIKAGAGATGAGGAGAGEEPVTVLDWTPFIREASDGS